MDSLCFGILGVFFYEPNSIHVGNGGVMTFVLMPSLSGTETTQQLRAIAKLRLGSDG